MADYAGLGLVMEYRERLQALNGPACNNTIEDVLMADGYLCVQTTSFRLSSLQSW